MSASKVNIGITLVAFYLTIEQEEKINIGDIIEFHDTHYVIIILSEEKTSVGIKTLR